MRDVEGYEERRKMIPKEGMPLVAGDHRANDTRSLVAGRFRRFQHIEMSFRVHTRKPKALGLRWLATALAHVGSMSGSCGTRQGHPRNSHPPIRREIGAHSSEGTMTHKTKRKILEILA